MHATTLELELYVARRLDSERADALERHCDACDTCATSLQQEAGLELALRSLFAERRCGTEAGSEWELAEVEAVALPLPVAMPRPRRAMVLLAAAACVLLAFVAARLPHANGQRSLPAAGAWATDAGDLINAAPPALPERLSGDLSHGTP